MSSIQFTLTNPGHSTSIMVTSSNGNIFRVTGPFLRGIHRSPVISPHNREAGDLRRHRGHYDVIVMFWYCCSNLRIWIIAFELLLYYFCMLSRLRLIIFFIIHPYFGTAFVLTRILYHCYHVMYDITRELPHGRLSGSYGVNISYMPGNPGKCSSMSYHHWAFVVLLQWRHMSAVVSEMSGNPIVIQRFLQFNN